MRTAYACRRVDLRTGAIYDFVMKRIMALVLLVLFVPVGASAELLRKSGTDETRDVPTASVDFALRDGWEHIPTVHFRTKENDVVEVYDLPMHIAHATEQG